jgi:drug/metabolite transporter (DMT)-like permease
VSEKKYYFYIALSGCIFGSVSLFSALLRDRNVSSLQQSILRVFFAMILLSPIAIRNRTAMSKNDMGFFLLFGLIMALLGFLENTAIALKTPVAVVVLLMYTQPVWTALISRLFLGEQLNTKKGCAILLSLAGIGLITEFWRESISSMAGPAIALFSGFLLSCEFIFSKLSRQKNIHFTQSLFLSYVFRLIFTILLGFLLSFFISDPAIMGFTLSQKTHTWILLFLYGLIPMFVGMMILFFSIKYVSATSAGIILLLEPLSAVFYSFLFLGESIRTLTIVGGVFILVSSLLAMGE